MPTARTTVGTVGIKKGYATHVTVINAMNAVDSTTVIAIASIGGANARSEPGLSP